MSYKEVPGVSDARGSSFFYTACLKRLIWKPGDTTVDPAWPHSTGQPFVSAMRCRRKVSFKMTSGRTEPRETRAPVQSKQGSPSHFHPFFLSANGKCCSNCFPPLIVVTLVVVAVAFIVIIIVVVAAVVVFGFTKDWTIRLISFRPSAAASGFTASRPPITFVADSRLRHFCDLSGGLWQ